MNDQSDGTLFLKWNGSHGEVARVVLKKSGEGDWIELWFFYPDKQGNLKQSLSDVTIPLDQIQPFHDALRQVIKIFESASKSLRSKEQAAPKPAKKIKSLEKRSGSKK